MSKPHVASASTGERRERDKPPYGEVPDVLNPPEREGNDSNYEVPRGMPALPPMGRS
jgi:hypothetical protein